MFGYRARRRAAEIAVQAQTRSAESDELTEDADLPPAWREEYKRNAYVPDHAYDRLLAEPTGTEFLRSMSNCAVEGYRSERHSTGLAPATGTKVHVLAMDAAGFSGDVRKLRPISLLETMLKAVMTIVTSRLSAAMQKHGILRGKNNSVAA
ncbi:hypothetical protein RI367_007462 [Sorochytrium milnesiophthora]